MAIYTITTHTVSRQFVEYIEVATTLACMRCVLPSGWLAIRNPANWRDASRYVGIESGEGLHRRSDWQAV
jgi:hypothetical protein